MPSLALKEPLLLTLLEATESAAIAASAFVGGGDKIAVDAAAVSALRSSFDKLPVDAVVVVGEGEKDRAPMLFAGERLGTGAGPALDVAVDPVDGTRLAAADLPGAVAVLSVAASGAFFDPGPVFYMEKLVTIAAARGLSLRLSLSENLRELSRVLGKPIDQLRVAVQSRPRNQIYLDEATVAGAHTVRFSDGDVDFALRAARDDGDIDLLIGIGGAPEGVLTAAAIVALGAHMQARPAPPQSDEIAKAQLAGISLERVLSLNDLVRGEGYFFLTAITAGDTLAAVTHRGDVVTTDSWIVAPGSGLTRVIREHPVS